MRLRILTLLVLVTQLLLVPPAAAFEWRLAKLDGRDFVPLVKKINAIGKRALVVAWSMKSEAGTQVRYSGPLAGAAAYFLDMADLIDNPDDEEQRALVDQLFVDN